MVGSIAFSLGMALARLIEDSIISRGYFLSRNNCFMLSYWTSLLSVDEQILFILKNRENGIFLCLLSGWQLSKRRYLFLSVGFLYKSVSTLPFSIKHNVSKKGIFFFSGQSPLMGLFSIHVCSIVNLMFGLILFISSSSLCRFFVVPINTEKRSSKKLFRNFWSPNVFAFMIIWLSTFLSMKLSEYGGAGADPIAVPMSCLYVSSIQVLHNYTKV